MCEHAPRHVDVVVKELGLERGNSMQTLATHDAIESEAEPLDQAQHSKYRSQVARCLFLSQDRADITFIVNELCHKMSNPNRQSVENLKRLVRCLKRERQWGQVFSYRKMANEVTTIHRLRLGPLQRDSKVVTFRSDTAGQPHSEGIHTQAVIAKSSAESELYAAALGASESNGIVSLLKDLGYDLKPVLAIDVKATEHILHRHGIG